MQTLDLIRHDKAILTTDQDLVHVLQPHLTPLELTGDWVAANFVKKVHSQLICPSDNIFHFMVEPLVQGIQVSLLYVDSDLSTAIVTRSDGMTGVNVTTNLLHGTGFPFFLGNDAPHLVEVHGVVYAELDALQSFANEDHPDRPDVHFALLNKLLEQVQDLNQPHPCKALKFFATNIGHISHSMQANLHETRWEMLSLLKDWKFEVNPLNELARGADAMQEIHQRMQRDRESLPYPIAGTTYTLNSINLQKMMPRFHRVPTWAVAHLFS